MVISSTPLRSAGAVRIKGSELNPAASLFNKDGLSIAAGMNDPKNPYLSGLDTVEDHIAVDRESTDIGAQIRFEAPADVGKL